MNAANAIKPKLRKKWISIVLVAPYVEGLNLPYSKVRQRLIGSAWKI